MTCEACGGPLCGRGRAVTGCCARCRSLAAAFVRNWCADLRDAGHTDRDAARIVGISPEALRARRAEALR